MQTFLEWLKEKSLVEMQMRTQMKFGYPDGYGIAFYPMGYHMPTSADALINHEFRKHQKDIAPPNTAIPDPAGDKAQAEYRRKMGVLPKASG